MKFDINQYKGKYVMCCKTYEEAECFCEFLDSIGRKWRNGKSYASTNFFDRNGGGEICYEFNAGYYATPRFYRNDGYHVLDFSDFEWSIDLEVSDDDKKFLNEFFAEFCTE